MKKYKTWLNILLVLLLLNTGCVFSFTTNEVGVRTKKAALGKMGNGHIMRQVLLIFFTFYKRMEYI